MGPEHVALCQDIVDGMLRTVLVHRPTPTLC